RMPSRVVPTSDRQHARPCRRPEPHLQIRTAVSNGRHTTHQTAPAQYRELTDGLLHPSVDRGEDVRVDHPLILLPMQDDEQPQDLLCPRAFPRIEIDGVSVYHASGSPR